MKKLILITGGERSGKSRYAESLALSLSPNPVYLATARIWDEEFRQRVIKHQRRRGSQWTNIEEQKYLSQHQLTGRVVVVDCLTLWATNFFFDCSNAMGTNQTALPQEHPSEEGQPDVVEQALQQLEKEFTRLTQQDAIFIFVTNEIGSGGTHTNVVQRQFTDLLGRLNQFAAQAADEVFLMVSGINVKIKG